MISNVEQGDWTQPDLTAIARGTAAILLVLAGLLGVSHPTSAADGNFVNLSTRALVESGEEVMIGGFIIEGGAQRVLIQARGPELVNEGISNALADPVLTIIQTSEGEPPRTELDPPIKIMDNDNWEEDDQGELISDLWGGAPNLTAGSMSAALVRTLPSGGYTARVEGKDGTTGVAIVEIYGIDSPGGGNPDFVALTTLYNEMDGPNWIRSDNWGTDAPLSQWYGVEIDENGRVIELDLTENQLSGPIPTELVNLTNLRILRLIDNQLSGCIPIGLREIGNNDFSELGLSFCVDSSGADLVVRLPVVSDNSPSRRAPLTLSATVRNLGGGESAATTLRYYRSTDSTISSSDTEVGTDAVGALAAAGASPELILLTAPSTAGTYYYGACVDAVPEESDTTNNCSSSVRVDVE